jgi:RIO-like serine/threonine protein kinase
MTGRIKDLSVDRHGKTILMLEINERQAAEALYDELNLCEKCEITVKKWREKRSLDANALMWKACSVIADEIGSSKDEVYYEMLKKYGQSFVVKIKNCDAERFLRQYKYAEQHEKLPAEEHAQYFRVCVGSSNYNTKEMSILIDGILSEIEQMGILFEERYEYEGTMEGNTGI